MAVAEAVRAELARVDLFAHVDPARLDAFAAHAEELTLAPGDPLFRKASPRVPSSSSGPATGRPPTLARSPC